MFGNVRKFSENVRQRSCDLRTSFSESSEIFGRSFIVRLGYWDEFVVCSYGKFLPGRGEIQETQPECLKH